MAAGRDRDLDPGERGDPRSPRPGRIDGRPGGERSGGRLDAADPPRLDAQARHFGVAQDRDARALGGCGVRIRRQRRIRVAAVLLVSPQRDVLDVECGLEVRQFGGRQQPLVDPDAAMHFDRLPKDVGAVERGDEVKRDRVLPGTDRLDVIGVPAGFARLRPAVPGDCGQPGATGAGEPGAHEDTVLARPDGAAR